MDLWFSNDFFPARPSGRNQTDCHAERSEASACVPDPLEKSRFFAALRMTASKSSTARRKSPISSTASDKRRASLGGLPPLATCHSSLPSSFLIEFNRVRWSSCVAGVLGQLKRRCLRMKQRSVRRRGTRPGACQALLGRREPGLGGTAQSARSQGL